MAKAVSKVGRFTIGHIPWNKGTAKINKCLICGKEFRAVNRRGVAKKYCSTECKYRGQISQVEKVCVECNEKFQVKQCWVEKRKFCSKACEGFYKNKNQFKRNNPAWRGGVSKNTLGRTKNTARKGRYYENLARKQFEKDGYYVIRSAASKGIWDLIAIKKEEIIFIQVKLNRIPRIKEREAMEQFECPRNSQKQIWRFFGYGRKEILAWTGSEWIKESYN